MESTNIRLKKTIIIIFSLFLVLTLVFMVVFPLSQSIDFYQYNFKKYNISTQTGYTDSELTRIANHIIIFLKGDIESFHLEIDGRHVFSNQAIIHMKDVRDLLFMLQYFMFVIFILFIVLAVYIYKKRLEFKGILFNYSLITIGVILGILLIFGIVAVIDFDFAFTAFHKIIFPNAQKFEDSFFGAVSNYEELPYIENRMLIWILSSSYFINFALVVIAITIVLLGIYLVIAYLYKKKEIKLEAVED